MSKGSNFEEAAVNECVNYLAERGDYSEVEAFLADICKSVNFHCPCFVKKENAVIFEPCIKDEKLNGLGIESVEFNSGGFKYDESGKLTKEYVWNVKSKKRNLLGEDLKIYVTFFYGLLKVSDFPINKKIFANSLLFPVLYPYVFFVNSIQSDYRKYSVATDEVKKIELSDEAINAMRDIEFDVVVDTQEAHLEEGMQQVYRRRGIGFSSKINTKLLYCGNVMGSFEERSIWREICKYKMLDGRNKKITQVVSSVSKTGRIKFPYYNLLGKKSISYETECLKGFFSIDAEEKEKPIDISAESSKKVLEILAKCIKLKKHVLNVGAKLFKYEEVFDEEKLAELGIEIKYVKEAQLPNFHVKEDVIIIKDYNDRSYFFCYSVKYEQKEFFLFITKNLKKICAHDTSLSVKGVDIQIGYVEIASMLMFEISEKSSKKFLRKTFVEINCNAWEYLKNTLKIDILHIKRVTELFKKKKWNFSSVMLSKKSI